MADIQEIFSVLATKRPIRLRLGRISYFTGPDHDTVFAEVESEGVYDLHDRLRNLEHTPSEHRYKPHVTIACVKSGTGKLYAERLGSLDERCVCDTAVFSDADKTRHVYPLGRFASGPVAKAMSYLGDASGGTLVGPAAMGAGKPRRLRRNRRTQRRILKALGEIGGGTSFLTDFDLGAVDAEELAFGEKAFDPAAHPRETAAHDAKRPGEFAPKGEGGGAPAPRGKGDKSAGRAKAIAEAAAGIEVTDDRVLFDDVSSRDYDEIESRMSPAEREEMESKLTEWRDEWVNGRLDNLGDDGVNEIDAAKAAGWTDEVIAKRATALIGSCKNADYIDGAAREAINDWYGETRTHGIEAIDELADELGGDDEYSELAEKVRALAAGAESDIEDERQSQRDEFVTSQRERLEGRYDDDNDDKSDYLRQFFDDNESRFTGVTKLDTWGKDKDGDDAFAFETSGGSRYDISVFDRNYAGHAFKNLVFSDAAGSFKVTGAGGAHEVFSKVVPAVTALVTKRKFPALSFSAAEPSRQRLYDRLVRTVAATVPEYTAIAVAPPGSPKLYLVVLRDKFEAVRPALEKLAGPVETLVKAYESHPMGESRIQKLLPATDAQIRLWETADGWPAPAGSEPPAVEKAFDPAQPRDGVGRWSAPAGGGDDLADLESRLRAAHLARAEELERAADDGERSIEQGLAMGLSEDHPGVTLARAHVPLLRRLARERRALAAGRVPHVAKGLEADESAADADDMVAWYTKGFDPAEPRETAAHDGKRPGEWAPKTQRSLFDDDLDESIPVGTMPSGGKSDSKGGDQVETPTEPKPVASTDLRKLADDLWSQAHAANQREDWAGVKKVLDRMKAETGWRFANQHQGLLDKANSILRDKAWLRKNAVRYVPKEASPSDDELRESGQELVSDWLNAHPKKHALIQESDDTDTLSEVTDWAVAAIKSAMAAKPKPPAPATSAQAGPAAVVAKLKEIERHAVEDVNYCATGRAAAREVLAPLTVAQLQQVYAGLGYKAPLPPGKAKALARIENAVMALAGGVHRAKI